jgi:GT2 family glycosyltransferase
MSIPFFSVVVPTRSRPERLAACLGGLARLNYPRERLEVIVVDDGSDLEQQVESSGGLHLRLIRQYHSGPAAARNLGAAHAEGEYLAFLDDDCVPDPGWLDAFAARFSVGPETVLGGRTINGLPDNVYAAATQLLLAYLYSYYRKGGSSQPGFFASNNIAMPGRIFRQLGGFSTRFRLAAGEDRELCARALDRGMALEYVPDAVVSHSHSLDLRAFWRQHFNYGRGAFVFHELRGSRGPTRAPRFEPLRFYLGLVAYPLAVETRDPPEVLCALLALSQLANAAGFFREVLSRRDRITMRVA